MSIQDQIAEAQKVAAANAQTGTITADAVTPAPAASAPAPQTNYAVSAAPLSVVDAVNSSMTVDAYLKVQAANIEVDGKSYRKVPCIIKCADTSVGGSIQAFIGLNYGNDADAKYSKTFNRHVVEDGENLGMPWLEHVAQVQQLYPKAKPFNGYALILEVEKDFADQDGVNPLPKGMLLGYSTSATSAKEVAKLVRKLMGEGLWGSPEEQRLVLVNGKSNTMQKDGKTINWNTLVLEDQGVYADVE